MKVCIEYVLKKALKIYPTPFFNKKFLETDPALPTGRYPRGKP